MPQLHKTTDYEFHFQLFHRQNFKSTMPLLTILVLINNFH